MRKSAIGVARRFGLGAALALALFAGVAPVPAGAATQDCSCLVTSEEEQRAQADVVFKGTLDGSTSSVSTDPKGEVHESGLVHHFTPTSVYDGTVYSPQSVVEPPDMSASCGVAWEGPGPYLVFAEVPSDAEQAKYDLGAADLLLKPCGGTRPIDADDEPSFGPGTPVTSEDEPTTAAQDEPTPADEEDPEFPLPGFRYLIELLDDVLAYLGYEPDEDGDDSLLGLGGMLRQLLELLGLVQDQPDDGGLSFLDLAQLQEQLKNLPTGPGGEGPVGAPLDLGGLGGIGTPPPPGDATLG